MKKLLLILTLGTAGFLAVTTAAQAEAREPELAFHPAKAWSVESKPIEIASAQAQNCSIGTEFNNGFILQLNGSHKWVQSLSLDLRQGALEAGKSYPVTLSAPGIAHIGTSGKAVSPSRIEINIDGQKDLYKAVKDNAVLDLGIEQNAFRFYLVNFAGAAKPFEDCMAGGTVQTHEEKREQILQAARSEDPFAAITANEAIAFEEAETQKMNIDVPPAARQNPLIVPPTVNDIPLDTRREAPSASLSAKLLNQKQPEALAAPLAETPQEAVAATPEEPEIKIEIAATVDPVEPPAEEIAATMTAAVEDAPEAKAEAVEIETKEVALAEIMPVPTKKISVKSPEPQYTKETEMLRADFTDPPAEDSGNFENNTAPAAGNPVEKIVYTQDPDIGRKIAQLEGMINVLEQENATLQGELDAVLEESREERLSISSENWNLERATMRFNEAERQLKTLGQQLQRERAQCNMEKQELEAMLFDPQVTSQQQMARLAELEAKLRAAQQQLGSP